MDLLKAFTDYANRQHLFSSRDRLLLAVSGGLDSVVLCELCHLAGLDFVIAHCNFQLRGAESDRDEEFIRKLGEKYNKPVFIRSFDTQVYAAAKKRSIQVAARELRYDWFQELIATGSSPVVPNSSLTTQSSPLIPHGRPITRIVTAHHLDDNIETLLMNFFKGTGIAGLRGILPTQGKIVRPLLFAGKEELRLFATQRILEWVEDSSNESDKYTRNYFRHQVIPLVEKVYPGALHNLADHLDRFRGIEWVYRGAIDQYKKKLLEPRGKEIHIPVLKLKKSTPLPEALRTLVYEIIRDFDFSPQQVEELIRFLDSETGRYIESATHRILKNRNWLIISPHPSVQAAHVLIESPDEPIVYENGELHFQQFETSPDQPLSIPNSAASSSCNKSSHNKSSGTGQGRPGTDSPASNSIAFLDAASIRFPLLLRKWKPGDYFYPLGMRKKKKLARFLIDNKLSGTDKEKIWVLEMDKKVIWVVGLRIDDRFRISPHTRNALKIESRLH